MHPTSRPTLDTLLSHRSIRRYTGQAIDPEQLNWVLEAGRAASSSSFMQCVHIIRVDDAEQRKRLCTMAANQKYIVEAAAFLVFCIDYSKHRRLVPDIQIDYTEATLLGAIDAGIMAQNVLAAAESLGLGGVFIGALRNDIAQVAQVLQLPNEAVPLFGLCLGHPNQDPEYRPRLPLAALVSENVYRHSSDAELADYNRELAAYYERRNGLQLDWTAQIRNTLAVSLRPHILPFLQKCGLAKR